ncbi:MAG: DUF58 domain-containing protein [Eubacterium sp.]|nr:DUF58 domain-containing protein [Eubacterium sp.]
MRKLRAIEYMILLGIDLALCWFFAGYFFFILAFAMVAVVLVSLFALNVTSGNVDVYIKSPVEKVDKGTELYIEIGVTNKSIFPVIDAIMRLRVGNPFVGELEKIEMEVPIPASRTMRVKLPIKSQYAGEFEIHIDSIEMHDLLGFRKRVIKFDKEHEVFIYPLENKEFHWDKSAYEVGFEEASESKLRGSDFSDVSQVREYVQGDPIKNIHWKLSAKKDELMVKERLQSSSQKMIIIFEVLEKRAELVDEALDNMYTLGRNGIRNQVPVELWWWDKRHKEIAFGSAQSFDEWDSLMNRILHSGSEFGYVRDQFENRNLNQGFILVSDNGIEIISSN